MYALVAVPHAGPEPLTYAVPPELVAGVVAGVRVRVPLRGREVTGLVVATAAAPAPAAAVVRPLAEVLDEAPLLPLRLLELARFVSAHYRCPLAATLDCMLPALLLRADAERARLTVAGVGCERSHLPPAQAAILTELERSGRLAVPTLLARAGCRSRSPLAALVAAGWVTLEHMRRDRSPAAEVTAVGLPEVPVADLLARADKAPKRREVLEWLAAHGRPALLAEVVAATGCSPSTVRAMAAAGLVHTFTQAAPRASRWRLPAAPAVVELSPDQAAAVAAVTVAVSAGGFAPFLLQGVTGSGKTEVYLRCLEAVVARGATGLVLVPEIGLTPAAAGEVTRRFGERVAVLHSAQSEGERWREWQRVGAGDVQVVVGPRSALFAPLPRLGLIVVDEEHDGAYKQQESPRYSARDLALVAAKQSGVPVVLASATPSVEAAALVERGMATLLRLDHRVAGGTLPVVELVDLRGEPPEPGEQGRALFSRRLREVLAETLERGRQAILLIQRRGWAPVLLCRLCGRRSECEACSVAMVVHRRSGDLRCHYCGARRAVPASCPSCGGALLEDVGAGTEKVAHLLAQYFPEVTAAILDRDTAHRRGGLEETIGRFAEGHLQVLVGTQMVAKGHHFPGVTLTGVISADALLGLPDFRAGERTFQLITQAAGRAGRGDEPGRVVVQTYYPDHPALRHAVGHDVDGFLAAELRLRRAFAYPPAVRLAVVRCEATTAARAEHAAVAAAAAAAAPGVRLRGPSPAPLERIRSQWRWQVLLSAATRAELHAARARRERPPAPAGVRRVVDVDPLSTL